MVERYTDFGRTRRGGTAVRDRKLTKLSVTIGVVIFIASLAGQATGGGDPETIAVKLMEFDECLLTTQRTITSLGVAANRVIPIVNTGALQMTKVVGDDGNYIFTCSRPDRKLVITKSTPPDWHLVH